MKKKIQTSNRHMMLLSKKKRKNGFSKLLLWSGILAILFSILISKLPDYVKLLFIGVILLSLGGLTHNTD